MPLEEPEESPHVIAVGRITIFLAGLGLLRIVPEAVAMRDHLTGLYTAIIIVDFYLLLPGLAAGFGLIDQPAWCWRPALLFWGAAPLSSILIGIGLVEEYSPGRGFLVMVPRVLLYGATALLAPYAIWGLVTEVRDGRPPLLTRLGWLAAGIVFGGAVGFLLIQRPVR